MSNIPSLWHIDSTLGFRADPYRFISKQCEHLQSDLFQTRILLQKTVCMTGRESAILFYDQDRFVRRGAMPVAIQKTLVGQRGVQGLDGELHRTRKQMFLDIVAQDRLDSLLREVTAQWEAALVKWSALPHVDFYPEVQLLLARAVCAWTGVPLPEAEVQARTTDLVLLFDAAGAVGPRHFASRRARRRLEEWLAGVIQDVRQGRTQCPQGCALAQIAAHQDAGGKLLAPQIAAVELLNVIRPTIAVSVYVVFVGHALEVNPACRERLSSEPLYAEAFAHEVRRYYPFFPAVAARVRHDFAWRGYRFEAGCRVMLDLFGTNRDPRAWDRQNEFLPQRFLGAAPDAYSFIPQGGGTHEHGHRCPGERVAVEIMKLSAATLAQRISYEIPPQDLSIDWARLPALPRSRLVLRGVRLR